MREDNHMQSAVSDKAACPNSVSDKAECPSAGRAKVALVSCNTYNQIEVDNAVRQAIELIGGFELVLNCERGDKTVIKPNLLAKTSPEKACTTHPAVFEAVIKAMQAEGYSNITYGDSPGNPVIKPEKVAQECGLKEVADRLGISFGNFSEGEEVPFTEGRIADSFTICKEIIEADCIINVCKMKTHQLERITGAVKNTFGCVYGVNKAASHAKYSTAETFAKMLGDLNNLVSPKLHIMDGVVAMEGNGPQSGTPKAMNVILASTDPVALDSVFCHLINLEPELVPTNITGQEQGVGTYMNIEVVTEEGVLTLIEASETYGDKDFDVQRDREYRGTLRPIRFLMPLIQKKPVIVKEKCVSCGICVETCPVEGKAIFMERSRTSTPYYDYKKCIKCYCCQEMCPQSAIVVKKGLSRLFRR